MDLRCRDIEGHIAESTPMNLNRSKLYPGFWHAVLLCVTFVAVQVAFLVVLAVVEAVFKVHLSTHPAVMGAVNLIACAMVMMMGWLIGRTATSEVFAFRRISLIAVLGVTVASAGAIILLSEADNLVRLILPVPEWIARIFNDLSSLSGHVWASVFLLVMVAPVTEELMFRGLILRGFLRRFSVVKAFLLSAFLFGAVHLNPWQFVSASALGVMFAWWYARTQSLVPSLIGHALVNAMVVSHRGLPFEVPGFNAGEPFTNNGLQPFWFDLVGSLLLATGLWLFHRATPPIQISVELSADQPPPPVAQGSETPPIMPSGGAESAPARPPQG